MKALWIAVVALAGLSAAPQAAADDAPRAQSLRECAVQLADTLAGQLGTAAKKIAVTSFIRLNEGEVALGAQLADELDSALFRKGRRITLVERRRLTAAVSELHLSAGDLFEAANVRRVGRFLGADAIIVGTIYAGEGLNVVARAIRVETGDVLAAAEATLEPKPAYRAAFEQRVGTPPAPVAQAALTAKTPPPSANGAVFLEDFTSLKEGTAPAHWLGVEHFGVAFEKRGTPVFQAFEPGAARFSIPRVSLPSGNFSVVWVARRDNGLCASQPHMLITVGNLRAGAEHTGCGSYRAVLNNTHAGLDVTAGSPHRFELRRDGDIYTLWMDGTRLLLVRKTDFQPGDTLVVDLDAYHDTTNRGTLYSVEVRRLE